MAPKQPTISSLTVIMPAYNEEDLIAQSVATVEKKLQPLCCAYEILVVDDGSQDKTSSILHNLRKTNKHLTIVPFGKNRGYGAALREGIKKAKHQWVLFTDADIQFDLQEVKHFLPYVGAYDFIVGFRKNRADNMRRKFISFVYNRVIRMMFHLALYDVDCAFKLMKTSVVRQINFTSNSFFVSVELMVKAGKKGCTIKQIGVSHYPRVKGQSKVTPRTIVRSMRDLVKLYRQLMNI